MKTSISLLILVLTLSFSASANTCHNLLKKSDKESDQTAYFVRLTKKSHIRLIESIQADQKLNRHGWTVKKKLSDNKVLYLRSTMQLKTLERLARFLAVYVQGAPIQRQLFFKSTFISDNWGSTPKIVTPDGTLELDFHGTKENYAKNLALFMSVQGDVQQIRKLFYFYEKLNDEITDIENLVESDSSMSMNYFRTYGEYRDSSGDILDKLVEKLGPKDIWMDGGIAVAQKDVFYRKNGAEDLKLREGYRKHTDIAFTVSKPNEFYFIEPNPDPYVIAFATAFGGAPAEELTTNENGFKTRRDLGRMFTDPKRFELISGKPIEEYDLTELQSKLKLYTDYFSAFQYAMHVDSVMDKIGNLIKPGGHLLIHMREDVLKIVNKHGRELPVREWLKRVKGFEYVSSTEGRLPSTYLLRRTTGPVESPRLQLINIDRDEMLPAPARTYVLYE